MTERQVRLIGLQLAVIKKNKSTHRNTIVKIPEIQQKYKMYKQLKKRNKSNEKPIRISRLLNTNPQGKKSVE